MNLDHHMVDTVTIASASGIGNDGDKTYSSQTEIKARVEPIRKLVKNASGKEVMSDHKIITSTEIKWDDRIWLPTDTPASDDPRRPLKVKSGRELNGNYILYEVYL